MTDGGRDRRADRAEAGDAMDVEGLGAVLRAARHAHGLSLESLASTSGVSVGLISQLERGLGNPSFLTLRRLASALEVPLGHFLQGPEPEAAMVVRAGERKHLVLPHENITYELLTPDLQGTLEVLRSQIPAGFDNQHRPFQHDGEECVHLLEGALDVTVGTREFSLVAGDAITYDSSVPHWWVNRSGSTAVIIGAVTPPSF